MIWGDNGGDADFDDADAFVAEHLPDPGAFLDGHAVLVGDAHVAVHQESHDRFEQFGVYDATFGYNLARLNLDHRHPAAGFRYGIDPEEPDVLRAEFTPTTEFCPQSTTLSRGVFRAWNATESDYRLVSVRVDPMHHRSAATNERLRELEAHYVETGDVVDDGGTGGVERDGGGSERDGDHLAGDSDSNGDGDHLAGDGNSNGDRNSADTGEGGLSTPR